MPEPIVLAEHDAKWGMDFVRLRAHFSRIADNLPAAIEHIGSTSVPGLIAKPIIDIDLTVSSNPNLVTILNRLIEHGYVNEGDCGIAGRVALRSTNSPIRHHLYLMQADHPEFHRHISFRNYLRSHPESAAAYAEIKMKAAIDFHHDRQGYTQAKSQFIEAVLLKCSL